ncbi:hypothetical protein AWN76_018495 [Rhodothermaceae bacterium RA]|nr:hypothetical protein AWN76_018495 [Rhodothermaceae bacterium RA]
MFWIWLVTVGVAALMAVYIALRRYERESAAAAQAAVEALREEIAALRTRVQALEAIVADEPLDPDPLPGLPDEPVRSADPAPPRRARSGV